MINLKPYILVVVAFLLFAAPKAYAAFPLQPKANNESETVARQTDVDFKALVNSAIERFTQRPAPSPASDGMEGSGIGIASLVTGIVGILALAFAAIVGWPAFVFSILAGVAAIILGAMGIKQSKRGLAIAGLVLGIVNLSLIVLTVLLALFIVLLFLSAWE